MTQEYFSNWTTCWPDGFRTLSEILMAPSLPPHHYEVIETGKQRVSDTLTNVDDFSKACAVLIDAPTGSGKSTFVLKTLSQYAQKQSKYILFLSNRSTLNFQNKLLASAGKPKVGPTALSNIKVVGNFVLCTYQDILHMLSHIDGITLQTRVGMCPREVGYVVLDEANFFCSDATFNGKTSRILREVIMKYYMCPRIYMSATMGDVRPLILHEEQFARSLYPTAHTDQCRFMWNAGHPLIKDYRFESDYSSIHLHFFVDWESIKQEISNSDSKWLVFVSDSELGKTLSKDIPDSRFVNSSYVREHQGEVVSMVEREKFVENVLISTSVFDSGINFHDDQLKNIVVDSEDLIQITQMLGRKRRKAGERVELYVMLNSESTIDKRLRYNQMLQKLLQEAAWSPDKFRLNKWGNLELNQQKLFDLLPTGQLVVNAYAPYQLALLEGKYQCIKSHFPEKQELAFAYEVCEWFGQTYTEEMRCGVPRVDSISEKVIACLEASIQKAQQDGEDSNKYILSKEDVLSLAIELREIVKPILYRFDYIADSGAKRNRLHKGKEKDHMQSDVKKVIEVLELPYDLAGREETFYIRRIENVGYVSVD